MVKELTQARLKELYRLNDKGNFVGVKRGCRNYGRVSGTQKRGISIDGKQYIFSRLKTLYITGILPEPTRGGHRARGGEFEAERNLLTAKWV